MQRKVGTVFNGGLDSYWIRHLEKMTTGMTVVVTLEVS